MLRATFVSLGKRVAKGADQTWREAISPYRSERVWVAHGKQGIDMEWPELPKSVRSLFDEGKVTFCTRLDTTEYDQFKSAFLAALKDANHTVGKWLILLPPGSGNRLAHLQALVDEEPAMLGMEVAQTRINGLLVGIYTPDFTNTDEVMEVAHKAHRILQLPSSTFSKYKPIGVTQLEGEYKTESGATRRTKMFTAHTAEKAVSRADIEWLVKQVVDSSKASKSGQEQKKEQE
eukprot:Rhum_TRINITY_DN25067_c0_g1::Rhum_TRINITY_DN25067_c0_g1_i1::g.180978::m.180978